MVTMEQSAICNFADDNTLYSCGKWLTEVKENLIFHAKGILKANPGKFHSRILGDNLSLIAKTY